MILPVIIRLHSSIAGMSKHSPNLHVSPPNPQEELCPLLLASGRGPEPVGAGGGGGEKDSCKSDEVTEGEVLLHHYRGS